jgi:hypothetical protein
VWYIVFFCFFAWTILPEYIFIVLTGVSIVCLADQNNLVITNLFGGASGNEGLGFLSLCFDWNYIAAVSSPMWYPLQTTVNMLIGIIGCYILFMGECSRKSILKRHCFLTLTNRYLLREPLGLSEIPIPLPILVQRIFNLHELHHL